MNRMNIPEDFTLDEMPAPPPDESYALFGYAATMAEMDVVVKNLQINGVDAIAFYFPSFRTQTMNPTLYVKKEMLARAKEILSSLDLNDFLLPSHTHDR